MSGTKKKILSEKTSDCVINLSLCKEKYLFCNSDFHYVLSVSICFCVYELRVDRSQPFPQVNSSLSSIDVNELRSEHKSCE